MPKYKATVTYQEYKTIDEEFLFDKEPGTKRLQLKLRVNSEYNDQTDSWEEHFSGKDEFRWARYVYPGDKTEESLAKVKTAVLKAFDIELNKECMENNSLVDKEVIIVSDFFTKEDDSSVEYAKFLNNINYKPREASEADKADWDDLG